MTDFHPHTANITCDHCPDGHNGESDVSFAHAYQLAEQDERNCPAMANHPDRRFLLPIGGKVC